MVTMLVVCGFEIRGRKGYVGGIAGNDFGTEEDEEEEEEGKGCQFGIMGFWRA